MWIFNWVDRSRTIKQTHSGPCSVSVPSIREMVLKHPKQKMCIFQLIWQNHQADPSAGLAATISIRKWFVNIPTKAVENLEAMDWFPFLCVSLSPSLSFSLLSLSLLLYMAISSDKSQSRWGALFRNLKALTHHSRFARPGGLAFPNSILRSHQILRFSSDMTTSLFTSRRPTAVNFNSPVQVLSHCLFCNNPFAWECVRCLILLIFLLAWLRTTSTKQSQELPVAG